MAGKQLGTKGWDNPSLLLPRAKSTKGKVHGCDLSNTTCHAGAVACSSRLGDFFISIESPEVIGALLRKPTYENLLLHYVQGKISIHGDLIDFITDPRACRSPARIYIVHDRSYHASHGRTPATTVIVIVAA